MPTSTLVQPKNTKFEVITALSTPYPNSLISHPKPYYFVGSNGTKGSKIINASGSTTNFSKGVQIGDYAWIPAVASSYLFYRIITVSPNQITIDRGLEDAFSNAYVYIIRPQFCKTSVTFIPISVGMVGKIDGESFDLGLSPVTLNWEKSADSHSAERNLLGPIAIDISGLSDGSVLISSTTY